MAEAGAKAALERLAVGRAEPFPEMSTGRGELRTLLRASGGQLGDRRQATGQQELTHLVAECAYEHWHRMLFARFLAENQLLIHSEFGVPVTLAECEELAHEAGEDAGWALAGRFAARMLPAVFRPNDPVLRVRLAPEHQQRLETLLAALPAEVFTADDALGWVYQFWQAKRKKEVNQSGRKIGADELPAVTQLFTEPYMVQFLLHNALGAWWAGKVLADRSELAQTAAREDELRRACAPPGYEWTSLRFFRDEKGGPWCPAAGTFQEWPAHAGEVTVLDPCCGSGHFLVEAFRILVPMRMAEEGLSAREATEAVLRDNLFGLEIDERCTQIAAFNLALAAWAYPGTGGYRSLPELNIACSGLSVGAREEEWFKLTGENKRLREGMRRLYRLFKDAPTLGSLIDPRREKAELFKAGFEELQPLLETALESEELKRDATRTEAGIAAQGMARAGSLLTRSYTLVATNVPYLQRSKHERKLSEFCALRFPQSKGDLATVMVERCLDACTPGGTIAIVAPQHGLLLKTYSQFRKRLLCHDTIALITALGPGAFDTVSGEIVNVSLYFISRRRPSEAACFATLDANEAGSVEEKAHTVREGNLLSIQQRPQLGNPDHKILLGGAIEGPLLEEFAKGLQGIATADYNRFGRCFWEMPELLRGWVFQQSTVRRTLSFGGREHALFWEEGQGALASSWAARVQGLAGWNKAGVAVSQMSALPVTRYTGETCDNNTAVVLPRDSVHLPAIWTFCSSSEFVEQVRRLDKKINVTNATLPKVPFDFERWQKEADRRNPNGLPRPYSDDSTQWLFHGHPLPCAFGPALESPWPAPDSLDTSRPLHPEGSGWALQVAVGRLLGYRWPAELDPEMELAKEARAWIHESEKLLDLADEDGLVCIPPVGSEQPAVGRLQELLRYAFGSAWTEATLPAMLEFAGHKGKTFDDWLRNGFFDQHCQIFHQRPFVLHVWDGRRRDGFAALVNYHKLDRKLLERLTYTVLGNWIERQRQDVKVGERGAEDRLAAAEALKAKLAAILEGEPPYDIFVRWKPLLEQPIGWEPDLHDGVRMNIRPFVEAGVLRKPPRIKWTKDHGKEPHRERKDFPWFWLDGTFTGKRVNDVHLTHVEKYAARDRAAAGQEVQR